MAKMKQLAINFHDNEDEVNDFLNKLKNYKPHIYILLFNNGVLFEAKLECLKNIIDNIELINAVFYKIYLDNTEKTI